MKYLKLLGTLLLFIAGVTAVLSLIMPVKQTIERTITINAPAALVYGQLASLEKFNTWAVWNRQDSTVQHSITGKDETVGAISTWKGNPDISGEGKMEIIELEENKKIGHSIHFLSPKSGHALSTFTLKENNNSTTVTWSFDMETPRPWNIFNLFYSMEKQMGKDFDEGLATLKSIAEKKNGTAAPVTAYSVEPMNFPATTFAIIRQQVKWSDISAFYAQHLPIIDSAAKEAEASPGTPAGLNYVWDEKNQQADIAAAFPVSPGAKIDNPIIQVITIPATKAVFVNYYGAYDKISAAYTSIDNYLSANKLKQKAPVIEQYITGPATEKDTSKWLTKIVFPVE